MSTRSTEAPAAPEDVHWLSIPAVQIRYNRRATGKPDLGWHAYCLSFVPLERAKNARMLVLGCASGWLERDLFRRGAFSQCDVVDPSPIAVAAARALADAEGCGGISYTVADLSVVELPQHSYDAVWSDGSLCRTRDVEHLTGQIARSLKPGGLLFANEYVGPSRYALPASQREAIQAAFSLIPRRYRRRADRAAADAPREVELPGPGGDPSDAAPSSSGDVLRTLRRQFELVESRALGGTILQFLLEGIAPNFKTDGRIAGQVLDMLFAIEDTLIDSGELGSDFALVVARPKSSTP